MISLKIDFKVNIDVGCSSIVEVVKGFRYEYGNLLFQKMKSLVVFVSGWEKSAVEN